LSVKPVEALAAVQVDCLRAAQPVEAQELAPAQVRESAQGPVPAH